LFEDQEFPATNSSIYYSKPIPDGIQWRRAGDVFPNPQFVINGFEQTELYQGFLANYWFLAGIGGVLQSNQILNRIIPVDQGFGENYTGMRFKPLKVN
jgi:hypothetical protein